MFDPVPTDDNTKGASRLLVFLLINSQVLSSVGREARSASVVISIANRRTDVERSATKSGYVICRSELYFP